MKNKKFRVVRISFPTEPEVVREVCSQCNNKVNDGYNVYEKRQGAKPTFMCCTCYFSMDRGK